MDMTCKNFVITEITDVNKLANLCSLCGSCVEVRKGRWVVDGSSIMGLMSIDLSQGATIAYDEDKVTEDFKSFVISHEV